MIEHLGGGQGRTQCLSSQRCWICVSENGIRVAEARRSYDVEVTVETGATTVEVL